MQNQNTISAAPALRSAWDASLSAGCGGLRIPMGYTHYWRQFRAFSDAEWTQLTAEAKRICAKAQRGLYSGSETKASSDGGKEAIKLMF